MPVEIQSILSLIGALLGLVLVLFLAYYCTKLLGRRLNGGSGGRFMHVIDRVPLGPDRALLLVRAGGKVLLLGATAQHVDKLEEWEDGVFPQQNEPNEGNPEFSALLKEQLERTWGIKLKKKKDTAHG